MQLYEQHCCWSQAGRQAAQAAHHRARCVLPPTLPLRDPTHLHKLLPTPCCLPVLVLSARSSRVGIQKVLRLEFGSLLRKHVELAVAYRARYEAYRAREQQRAAAAAQTQQLLQQQQGESPGVKASL